jgi:ADP-ribose pyrophosphatase YjhB (NUDIX family)
MSHEVKIHDAQTLILRDLLFKPSAGFAELQKSTGLESDHFKFHIKKVVELGYVEKMPGGDYCLTKAGKEHANKLDTDTNTIERQPKVSILICGWRTRNDSDEIEYLVTERLKNPYYGFLARVGGKQRWGETVIEGAARELMEEAGLEADFEYVGIYHKMDYLKETGELLEDKIFVCVTAQNFRGELTKTYEGGANHWMTIDEIKQHGKWFYGLVEESENFVNGLYPNFTEKKFHYSKQDY